MISLFQSYLSLEIKCMWAPLILLAAVVVALGVFPPPFCLDLVSLLL